MLPLEAQGALKQAQELLTIQSLDCAWVLIWFGLYFLVSRANIRTPAVVSADPARKLEWDMRLVSNVHAITLLLGSLQTFRECSEVPDHELIFGYSRTPDLCARIFRAYLVYDFFMCAAFYSLLKDTGTLVHHMLFLPVVTYALQGSYFKFPFAWLTLGELSSPFVNLRWQLAITERKNTALYLINGCLLALTFLVGRVLAYTYGLHHLLFRIRSVWLTEGTPAGMYFLVLGLVAAFGLNLFWFSLIIKGLKKLIGKKGTASGESKKAKAS